MVTVYHGEKVQTKINEWKRFMVQNPGEFHMWNFQLSSLHEVMDNVKLPSVMCGGAYGLLTTSQVYQNLGF